MRRAPGPSNARRGLRPLLALDPPADAAALRRVRRAAADVARHQPASRAMPALPAYTPSRRPGAVGWHLRRRAARDRARAQIRRAPLARPTARGPHAQSRIGHHHRVGRRGSCAPARVASAPAWLQSGGRSCSRPGAARRPGAAACAPHGRAGVAAGRPTPRQRPRRLCRDPSGRRASRTHGAAGRRCQHDRRDARGVCASAQGDWCAGGAGADSGENAVSHKDTGLIVVFSWLTHRQCARPSATAGRRHVPRRRRSRLEDARRR